MARPSITLKLATSLDGKIALSNGASEWITGEESRAAGRQLRAEHDAIAVGANTAHLDNPQLTSRIPNAPDPVRVIFDSRVRLSPLSNLAQTANETPVFLFCETGHDEKTNALSGLGIKILPVENTPHGLDILSAMQILRSQGIDCLLIEGGGKLAASFIALGIVDRIEWFRAPMILGGDGRDSVGALSLESMDAAYRYERVGLEPIGTDIHETYQKRDL